MRRVVVTGLGITSCLGNNAADVTHSLREGRRAFVSMTLIGILGFAAMCPALCTLNLSELIDRKILRFMGDAAAFAYLAMQQAITDAGLEAHEVSKPTRRPHHGFRWRILIQSGRSSGYPAQQRPQARRTLPRDPDHGVNCIRLPCYTLPDQGCELFHLVGCATSAHCIGNAMELIQLGKQDIVFAGGGEEEHWSLVLPV
jgi:3-oxoacyl-[acyl-carrier-protein] synthase-1